MSGMEDQLVEAMDVFQTDVALWAQRNFGDNSGLGAIGPMMGIVEEVGELYHTRLKAIQRIREGANKEALDEDEVDALGDILVYMMDYAGRRKLSLAKCFLDAWLKVKDRDWVTWPSTGRPPEGHQDG